MHFYKLVLPTLFILSSSPDLITAASLRNLGKNNNNGNGNGNGNGGGNGNGNGNGNGPPNKDDDNLDFIVKFKTRNDHQKFKRNEAANFNSVRHLDFANSEVIKFQNLHAAKNFGRGRNDVQFVEKDLTLHAFQNEEQVPYGIQNVEALNIPEYNINSNVKACIIDTGYGFGHPDLQTSSVTGYNPYSEGQWDVDGHSHGTHVAGTMAALQNNGIGVVGVTRSGNMPLRIGKGLTDSGSGSTSGVLSAMQDCVNDGTANGGKVVVNMSLGGGGASSSVMTYLEGLVNAEVDVLFVAAAGNGGSSAYSYPASYDSPIMMSVAAVDNNNVKAGFSQYNDQVDIAGPGVGVYSTITQNSGTAFGYASYSGTSMASPHVAAVAALVWSHYPDKPVSEIRRALECSAVMPSQYNGALKNIEVGHGVVNAKAAYDLLESGDYSACDATNTPTLSPTPVVCEGDTQKLEVQVVTDDYPTETSWKLTNTCSGAVVADSPAYTERGKTYSTTVCAPSSAEYSFEIQDSFGDGICCAYGSGSYKVFADGVEKISGGAFGSSETGIFGSCVVSPTASPTISPTVASGCPVGQEEVKLELVTDNYPSETSWSLSDACANTEITSGGDYSLQGELYIESACVPKDGSYTFTIFDSWGDGICCNYGSGSYKLYFGSTLVKEGGQYGGSEETTFGECQAEPTSSPTSSPSLAPTECNDAEGWYDSDGPTFNCDWYAQKSNCVHYGNQFSNSAGLTANEACCICGGGNI